MQKSNKRKYLLGALAVLLVAVVVGGTVAWLTASDSVKNTFTVGQITTPDPGDDDPWPDTPDDDTEETKFSGNIWEIFSKDPKIIPDSSITKTPYIGVGDGGEDAYVFAYVKNDMKSTTATDPDDLARFALGEGWKPVEATTTADGKYIDGLFVWCGQGGQDPTPLQSLAEDEGNNWTGALFSTVDIPKCAEASDFAETPTMTVYCYLYADVNNTTYAEAEAEAKTWVDNKWPESQGTAGTTPTTTPGN